MRRLLATLALPLSALLVCSLPAQSALIYDNGPIEDTPGSGVSTLQNQSLTHNTYGFGAQQTSTRSMADEFVVAAVMIIDDIELFCYQTGATNGPSTITGVYVELYNSDPSTGTATPITGSPGITNNILTATSTNVWSGSYRDLESSPGATNRPIMAVRVAVPGGPLVLVPGTYWIEFSFTGSLASGPWVPAIETPLQPVTGNALQNTAGVWTAVANGATDPAGVPFRLYGQGSVPGSISNTNLAACGNLSISVLGAPNLGGYIRAEIGNVSGLGLVGLGFTQTVTPFCTCVVGHEWASVQIATFLDLQIPLNPSLAGATARIQGADFGATGGCPAPAVAFSETYEIVLTN